MLGGVVKHVQPLDVVINANLKHIGEYRMQFQLDQIERQDQISKH